MIRLESGLSWALLKKGLSREQVAALINKHSCQKRQEVSRPDWERKFFGKISSDSEMRDLLLESCLDKYSWVSDFEYFFSNPSNSANFRINIPLGETRSHFLREELAFAECRSD